MYTLRFESAVLCSDVHLSTNTDKLSTVFIHWLKESCLGKIKARPEWLLILGDLFDAWIGDDIMETANPPEYLGRLVSILKEISQSGVKVGIWMNRFFDWRRFLQENLPIISGNTTFGQPIKIQLFVNA